MRIVLTRGAETTSVDVRPDDGTVALGGRSYAYRVIRVTPTTVELEIDGERVVVHGWPEGFASPPTPVEVNGELLDVAVTVEGPGDLSGRDGPTPAAPLPRTASDPPESGKAGELPVLPPMPGRVLEVRVRDGDRVEKGQPLLILEAMKMRNEIASPATGIVRRIQVEAGRNARAREPMLWIAPEPGAVGAAPPPSRAPSGPEPAAARGTDPGVGVDGRAAPDTEA